MRAILIAKPSALILGAIAVVQQRGVFALGKRGALHADLVAGPACLRSPHIAMPFPIASVLRDSEAVTSFADWCSSTFQRFTLQASSAPGKTNCRVDPVKARTKAPDQSTPYDVETSVLEDLVVRYRVKEPSAVADRAGSPENQIHPDPYLLLVSYLREKPGSIAVYAERYVS